MPESPEELYARTKDALRMPPVEEWEQWPFEGALRPRELRPPEERERPRFGEGGVDCGRCAAPDSEYIWTNETWRLWPFTPPNGLPLVVLLEPREHYAEPGDLPDELAADLGVMLARIEREIRALGNIGRVHVCRWGDGGEHLHWWFMARPARIPQLIGSFAAIWDDILPPQRSGEARQREGHLRFGEVDVRGRTGPAARAPVHRAGRPPPRPELVGTDRRGIPNAGARGDGRSAGRLGDRRQLREQARRHGPPRGRHDRLARPAVSGQGAMAVEPQRPPDSRRRRALARQPRELARRPLGPRRAVLVDGTRTLPPPAAVAEALRG